MDEMGGGSVKMEGGGRKGMRGGKLSLNF
jgi:hypothetical protein